MAIQIVQKQRPQDPLEKLANAVSVVKSIYGISVDSQQLDILKKKETGPESTYKDAVATDALKGMTASNDPNSPETAQARALAHATIGAWEKTKVFAPDKTGNSPLSPLKNSIDTMTGAQIQKALSSESPLFKTVSAASAADERSALAAAIASSRGNNLNERQNQNSVQAGHAWEADPIIKTAKTNLNSLNRSQSILNNTSKPLQSNDLNLAYTDYINSVAAGGAATEGKIHRELPQTFEQDWQALKQRLGDNGDLRKTPEGQKLITILQSNINQVKEDLIDSAAAQNESLAENYVGSTNPKVQKVVNEKRNSYSREALSKKFGAGASTTPSSPNEDQEAIDWAKANSNDPRAAQILKLHGM